MNRQKKKSDFYTFWMSWKEHLLSPAISLSICALNSERKRKQEEEEKSEEYERLKKEREYR